MDGNGSDNEELEKFFLLFKKFNYGFSLDERVQTRIYKFMKIK